MKRFFACLLACTMCAFADCAWAEAQPGALVGEWIRQAMEKGQRVQVQAKGEEARVTVGLQEIEGGCRVDAQIRLDGESVDVAVDVLEDRVSLRSQRLLPGERVDVPLHLKGKNVFEIAQPYGDAFQEFFRGLESRLYEPTEQADGQYPQADRIVTYDVTGDAIAGLLEDWIDALRGDQTLLPVIAGALNMPQDEVCEMLRKRVQERKFGEDELTHAALGVDHAGRLLYVMITRELNEAQALTFYFGKISLEKSFRLYAGVIDKQQHTLEQGFEIGYEIGSWADEDGTQTDVLNAGFYTHGGNEINCTIAGTRMPYVEGDIRGVKQMLGVTVTRADAGWRLTLMDDACIAQGGEARSSGFTIEDAMTGETNAAAMMGMFVTPESDGPLGFGNMTLEAPQMGASVTLDTQLNTTDAAQPAPAVYVTEVTDVNAAKALLTRLAEGLLDYAEAVQNAAP